jgi:hypothetical protein
LLLLERWREPEGHPALAVNKPLLYFQVPLDEPGDWIQYSTK